MSPFDTFKPGSRAAPRASESQQAGLAPGVAAPSAITQQQPAAQLPTSRAVPAEASTGSGPLAALTPVEGVALKDWARLQAAVSDGASFETMLAEAGIDRAQWDRVSVEWMARMQTDTTLAIATAYGNAFTFAAQGQHGAQAHTAKDRR